MFMFVLSFYLFSLGVNLKDGCPLLTVEWKASDNITIHVNYNPF